LLDYAELCSFDSSLAPFTYLSTRICFSPLHPPSSSECLFYSAFRFQVFSNVSFDHPPEVPALSLIRRLLPLTFLPALWTFFLPSICFRFPLYSFFTFQYKADALPISFVMVPPPHPSQTADFFFFKPVFSGQIDSLLLPAKLCLLSKLLLSIASIF